MTAPLVVTSRYLQTNATVLALPGPAVLVVDAPYFPDELAQLAAGARAGELSVRLFATHSHYDHLMGRLALPDAPLLAGPHTAAAVRREPDRPQHELAREDARTYVRRDRPLVVRDVEPVTRLEGVELVQADGHAGDGTAVLAHDGSALCCGDFLSDVEIPLLSWAGSLPAYAATLDRLDAVLAEHRPALVVPGHGSAADADGARRRLEEDRAYLAALPRADPDEPLPRGRETDRQREIHRANIERHA